MEVTRLRNVLEQRKGQKQQIERQIEKLRGELKQEKEYLQKLQEAREIVRKVALITQEQIKFHVSDLCSLALDAIFPDTYSLELDFVQRRGKTECDIYFKKGDDRVEPLLCSSGGVTSVASFALRIASWAIQNPRTRNILILDEPFMKLKGEEANFRILQLMKQLSQIHNLQIITVSDERPPREMIVENSDRVFLVTQKNKVSKVEQIS